MNRFTILFLFYVNLHGIRAPSSLNGLLNSNGASRFENKNMFFFLILSNEFICLGSLSTTNGKLTDEYTCKTEDGKSKCFCKEISSKNID